MSWHENEMQVYPCHPGSAQAVKTQSLISIPTPLLAFSQDKQSWLLCIWK